MLKESKILRNILQVSFLIVLILFSVLSVSAQKVRFKASIDTTNILIGDQVKYKLDLLIPKDYLFDWPRLTDSLTNKIEIVNMSEIDTIKSAEGVLNVSQVFTITSFDTGFYLIPPIELRYKEISDTDEVSIVESEPFVLNVFSVPVDLSQPIKPIKGPMAAPVTFRELLPWILILLIIGIALYFIVTRKKKKIQPVFFKPKLKLLPHIIAFNELEKLKKEKLWQQGLTKDYYTRLSLIIRQYIEDRFSLPAIESTTYDTMQMIRKLTIASDSVLLLENLLERSDLVKFAKAKPLPSEHDQSMDFAESFVRLTAQTVEVRETQNVVDKSHGNESEVQILDQHSMTNNEPPK